MTRKKPTDPEGLPTTPRRAVRSPVEHEAVFTALHLQKMRKRALEDLRDAIATLMWLETNDLDRADRQHWRNAGHLSELALKFTELVHAVGVSRGEA